jgi:hypothetical protein
LDEAPGRVMRERIARIIEQATRAFGKCFFLMSTRPQSYAGGSVRKEFHPPRIDDLGLAEISFFFDHFARALALTDTESSKFKADLEGAVKSRPEIREMARNPVMPAAHAVLQHNEQRLPAREEKPDRAKAEERLQLMDKLALRMPPCGHFMLGVAYSQEQPGISVIPGLSMGVSLGFSAEEAPAGPIGDRAADRRSASHGGRRRRG